MAIKKRDEVEVLNAYLAEQGLKRSEQREVILDVFQVALRIGFVIRGYRHHHPRPVRFLRAARAEVACSR